jgi:triosephosphate isomerase
MRTAYTFVANWKMYFDFNESMDYATKNLDKLISLSELPDSTVILCPAFPVLYPLTQIFKQTKVYVGSQNCSDRTKGALTGQVSVKTLSQLGCTSCIIGHSEIRRYKGETNEMIAQKFELLLNEGLSPILCIGESADDYSQGQTLKILEQQLAPAFNVLKAEANKLNGRPIYIAYEPEWSIGTGEIAPIDKLESFFAWINSEVQKCSSASNWQLLYGGSVDSQNVSKIMKVEYVSGFLIGNASTNFEEFEKIIKSTILERNN